MAAANIHPIPTLSQNNLSVLLILSQSLLLLRILLQAHMAVNPIQHNLMPKQTILGL
jgi:hypothetical protein